MIGRTNSSIIGSGGAVPDGATVTPVDDVTILVKCAGVSSSSSYTTIADVLGNDDTMSAITMDENAMKYLARSTGFADELCADETFMTFLGQSPYVDDTVLNSDIWVEKICNSQYMDKILNDLVPAMTSNTSSVGTAYVSPNSNDYLPYNMFDKDSTTYSGTAIYSSYPHYYGMNFNINKMIYAISIPIPGSKSPGSNGDKHTYPPKDCILQISDNGSDWKDIKQFTLDNTCDSNNLIVFSPVFTKYIRIKANNGYYTNYNWSGIFEWHIYGR